MVRILRSALLLLAFAWSSMAAAAVDITFHSFNGSILAGRYPHTFVSMEGTLEDGTPVKQNFGFSAKSAGPAVLAGPVKHIVMTEKEKWLTRTNRHFTLAMTDAQYREVRAMVEAWRNAPGKYYDLDTRNCIHFVGEIGRIMGLEIEYPRKLLRKPKSWLNHIMMLNPALGPSPID
ncbi:hypothetical protein [Erythrobacter sp. SD-21]|uniref:hypothetical protein n=1 Tax=Erythrobacter sp. SD-21 TaxID=161528 RepID=UPI000153F591|nr:hypothetical protein [Erythrobacter sp. SD-21]EDL49608.1 hypothetical protein ED21_18457 [Erythrobacter sp. SD-21]